MRFLSPALLALLFTLSFVYVEAFWRMVCGTIQTGRIDPIVSPNAIGGHCHTVAGPINFNINSTFASLQNAYCTSCEIQADLSAYWTPQMYYRHRNGSYEYVPHDGTVVYYLGRGVNQNSIQAFPPGLRMLSGDSGARAYDANTLTYNGNASYGGQPISDRVSFACLDVSGPIAEQPYMFRTNCSDGLRAQVTFQSCWDGVNLYKTDQSHVAYLNQIDNGICPPGYPVQFMTLFYELIYFPNNIDQTLGGQFLFSNGDTTGFGFHGDFLNGWDPDVLTAAVAQCGTTSDGSITDCPPLAASLDPYFAINCPEQPPIINETTKGMLPEIPGCNPPTGGPVRAAQNICAVQPALNYVNSTQNFTRFIPKPGTLLGTWSYLGCSSDNATTRALTGSSYTDTQFMTIESCTAFCHAGGWPLSGMEYSTQCYCGTVLPATEPILSPDTCAQTPFMVCSGNTLEYCGAPSILTVWSDTSYAGPAVLGIPVAGVTTLKLATGSPATNASYLGCHQEAVNTRALSGLSYSNSTGMTLESCAAFCEASNYLLFGTEYYSQCYCGNTINTAVIGELNCSYPCTGAHTEYCGGSSRLSVWQLNYPNAAPVVVASGTGTTATATGASTPTSTLIAGGTAQYLGCYLETTPRALTGGSVTGSSVTNDQCAAYAQSLNLPYFGTEYASQCYVGRALSPSSTPIAGAQCNMGCAGNAQETCGGANAISLYNNTLYVAPVNPNPVSVQGGSTAQYSYLGCYTDGGSPRVLSGNAQTAAYGTTTTNMTVEVCATICFNKGYTYMGVEYTTQCSCNSNGIVVTTGGGSLSANGDADCSDTCGGNQTEWCGGSSRMNIYKLKS